MLNKEYKNLLRLFVDENVRFLLVGAYALAAHGYVRATMDIDIWVECSRANSEAISRALKRFGADLSELNQESLTESNNVLRIGLPSGKIDIITSLTGLEFKKAYKNALSIELEGIPIQVISRSDLLINKRSTGRTRDIADAEALESQTD